MDAIREWAIMICSASVGGAIIVFLVPNGNLKKSVNIVITLFLLSIIVMPVFGENIFENTIPDLSLSDFPDENDYIQDYNDFFVASSELVIRQQIDDILSEFCSDEYDSDVTAYVDSEGNVVISDIHICIQISDSKKINIIKNKIESLTGISPEVTIENDSTKAVRENISG